MDAEKFAESIAVMMRSEVTRATAPLLKRVSELETAVEQLSAMPVIDYAASVAAAVEAMPKAKDGTSVTLDDVQPMILEAIQAAMILVPAPKDGTSVTVDDVLPMLRAEMLKEISALPRPKDGDDGKSVSLDDVVPVLNSWQSAWALDFERRAQELFQKAVDKMPAAKDGVDGFGLDDFRVELDEDGRTLVLSFEHGDRRVEKRLTLPILIDRGVYLPEKEYQRHDGVTYNGGWWTAQKDNPQGKPGTSADWRLTVKKGRDGADFRGVEIKPPSQVGLNGSKRP
jgi:hypothetical protein